MSVARMIYCVTTCCLSLFCVAFSQDLRDNVGRSLFSDQKGNRVGDAITVLVIETSSASNDAKTSGTRESALTLAGSGGVGSRTLPSPTLNLGTTNSFKGSGATESNGSVRAKISARVDSLQPNGNLWISGSRVISINGEDQVIKIFGVVRPTDVQPDNSVYSYNISDAKIVFEGSGIIDRSQGPGLLTKLFHWLF